MPAVTTTSSSRSGVWAVMMPLTVRCDGSVERAEGRVSMARVPPASLTSRPAVRRTDGGEGVAGIGRVRQPDDLDLTQVDDVTGDQGDGVPVGVARMAVRVREIFRRDDRAGEGAERGDAERSQGVFRTGRLREQDPLRQHVHGQGAIVRRDVAGGVLGRLVAAKAPEEALPGQAELLRDGVPGGRQRLLGVRPTEEANSGMRPGQLGRRILPRPGSVAVISRVERWRGGERSRT